MQKQKLHDLRDFLKVLRKENQLLVIEQEVDPRLEIAEIHRRVIAAGGPALLFTKVKGSQFPVVTNLFGTAKRIELAFGGKPQQFVKDVVNLVEHSMPPTLSTLWESRRLLTDAIKIGLKDITAPPVMECVQQPPMLSTLPLLTSWHSDAGPFVTLPLVYTEHPDGRGHNLGMYRIQRFSDSETGIHWQIHKGGGYHYHEAEKRGEALPLSLFLGGPPALMLAAIAPLPEDLPELLLASMVMGDKLEMATDPRDACHRLVARTEFAIKGKVPPFLRRPEGPFGDHYGYNSLQHDYPVFQISHIYHRKGAIYPATVVGRPKQEDFLLGDYLQELLSPLFPLVMKGVKELKTSGEAGFHCLAVARVENRYPREAFANSLRILGEGQLSLSKFLITTDGDVDLSNFATFWPHILERVDWRRDLFIFDNTSMDTLDYTGPSVNKGSKALLMGLGREKIRELPQEFHGELPSGCSQAKVFLPGTLVVQGATWEERPDLARELAEYSGMGNWPFVLLVDNVREATCSMQEFLWTFFTRFEPAADIHARSSAVSRFHIGLEPPVVIDSRLKPWYTDVLEVDPETKALVDSRYNKMIPPQWRP